MLTWKLGHSAGLDEAPSEMLDISPYMSNMLVPGEAQLIWCKAGKLPDYNYGANVLEYKWCEDAYWHYETEIEVAEHEGFIPTVRFEYLDYRYTIRANGKILADDEGMFTPVTLSLAEFAGQTVKLEVIIHPCPKVPGIGDSRSQARESVKPPVSYGWDWHPRLVTAGISGKAEFYYQPLAKLDSSFKYELTPALDSVDVTVDAFVSGFDGSAGRIRASIYDANDEEVAWTTAEQNSPDCGVQLKLTLANPKLWWPARQGEQYRYLVRVTLTDNSGKIIRVNDTLTGFRRVKLVMNEGTWNVPGPASQAENPFTLEINGRRIFGKGSNFVSPDIFYSNITREHYKNLITLALDANMNIFRMWGGSPVNKPEFFELCDKLGMMVWQEFPLACNLYPDKQHYLDKLETEATTIVRSLRVHPSVVMWCGGNELFNGWSGMTMQSLPLRLLDKVCYTEDPWTPFIMTSPVFGVAHGPYVNIVNDNTGKEALELFRENPHTAFTEFGCPGPAPYEYIKQYMDEKDIDSLFDLQPSEGGETVAGFRDQVKGSNSPWVIHHAVLAHWPHDTWFRLKEIEQYFRKVTSVEEACELGAIIQGIGYKAMFEHARRCWPHTSMAINWCWNEPWPCFANNTLVAYPEVLHPAYFDVKEALRDRMLSLEFEKLRRDAGEEITVPVWAFNDLPEELAGGDYTVTLVLDDDCETTRELAKGSFDSVAPTSVKRIGEFTFTVPADATKTFRLVVSCSNEELSSEYTLFRKD